MRIVTMTPKLKGRKDGKGRTLVDCTFSLAASYIHQNFVLSFERAETGSQAPNILRVNNTTLEIAAEPMNR